MDLQSKIKIQIAQLKVERRLARDNGNVVEEFASEKAIRVLNSLLDTHENE